MLKTSTQPMTSRQAEIHEFMLSYQRINGKPPTFREMCDRFEIKSQNGLKCHLLAMQKKGFVFAAASGESRRYRAIDAVEELTLELCALRFNEKTYKGSANWIAYGGRIENDAGMWYDAEDANAIAYYLDHGPTPK